MDTDSTDETDFLPCYPRPIKGFCSLTYFATLVSRFLHHPKLDGFGQGRFSPLPVGEGKSSCQKNAIIWVRGR